MRSLSIVLIIAVLLGAGYFYYSVTSYEPSTGTKIYDLPEQNIDDLIVETSDQGQAVEIEQTAEVQNARQLAKDALENYNALVANLPQQARDTMTLLIRLMAKGKLPTHFVDHKPAGYEQLAPRYELLNFDAYNVAHLRLTKGRVMCNSVLDSSGDKVTERYRVTQDALGRLAYQCVDQNCPPYEYFDVMIGDILANKFLCDPKLAPLSGDKVYLGGPGDDVVKHTKGNVIIDGGTGDDVADLGLGRKIMILSQGWGQDTININCDGAAVDSNSLPNFSMPWTHQFRNFLIFGSGIQPEDLKFNGLEISHIATGDKVTFNDYCFNIVFAEDFQASGIPDKID